MSMLLSLHGSIRGGVVVYDCSSPAVRSSSSLQCAVLVALPLHP